MIKMSLKALYVPLQSHYIMSTFVITGYLLKYDNLFLSSVPYLISIGYSLSRGNNSN